MQTTFGHCLEKRLNWQLKSLISYKNKKETFVAKKVLGKLKLLKMVKC